MPNSLAELLASAQTPDDLQAVADLLAEEERRAEAHRPPSVGNARFTVRTLTEVATFFGVQTQTAKDWGQAAGDKMPGVEGHWPLDEIARWKLRRALQDRDLIGADLARRKAEADVRIKEAGARKKEIANRVEEQDLVKKSDIDREVGRLVIEAREHLLKLPELACVSLSPAQKRHVQPELERHVEAALHRLADRLAGDISHEINPPEAHGPPSVGVTAP